MPPSSEGPMRALIAGNWKMNGLRADAAERFAAFRERAAAATPPCDVLICPPAPLIADAAAALAGSGLLWGGQDCHAEDKGAFTGDVAAPLLADLGCSHVIVGHSERRGGHGESDTVIAAKAAAAHRAGLVAIVCLGESAEERAQGRAAAVVASQLAGSLPPSADGANTVVAYEPIWAIGTGNTATPADVAEIHGLLRDELESRLGEAGTAVRLLYGGSVNAANAHELLRVPHVNGALVGGASLKPGDFWTIVEAAPH
ncbi:MAG: triose-phosphate isomerase [Proteobacteria bacterium]|nr:triose-phosphate isomerase [Pseudomonadota bacterium]